MKYKHKKNKASTYDISTTSHKAKKPVSRLAGILLVCMTVVCLAGCGQDFTKGTPFEKTTDSPTAGLGDSNNNSIKNGSEKDFVNNNSSNPGTQDPNNVSDNTGNKTPDNSDNDEATQVPDNNWGNASSSQLPDDNITDTPVPSGSDINSTDNPDNESSDLTSSPDGQTGVTGPAPTSSESGTELDRNEYWDKTFLIWLPLFNYGQLSKVDYAGTYDYATFTNVTAQNIKDYIASLKNSGFTNISVENYSDSAISFIATNSKSWEVRVSFTGSILVLGSGFNDSDSGNDDKVDTLFATTMLQYMPRFTSGTYVSSETLSDSSMYSSIVYTNVTENDALSYLEQVKKKGYVYVEDEGNSDGMIWYIAINDDRFECRVEFSGSELKIGCGYLEDD